MLCEKIILEFHHSATPLPRQVRLLGRMRAGPAAALLGAKTAALNPVKMVQLLPGRLPRRPADVNLHAHSPHRFFPSVLAARTGLSYKRPLGRQRRTVWHISPA